MSNEDLALTTGASVETSATVDAGSRGSGRVVVGGLVPSSPSAAQEYSVIATTSAAATTAVADVLDTVEGSSAEHEVTNGGSTSLVAAATDGAVTDEEPSTELDGTNDAPATLAATDGATADEPSSVQDERDSYGAMSAQQILAALGWESRGIKDPVSATTGSSSGKAGRWDSPQPKKSGNDEPEKSGNDEPEKSGNDEPKKGDTSRDAKGGTGQGSTTRRLRAQ
ncbi:hypothetical protein PHLGIDRAFT_129554 [Phlebiopsis gigantea 11061_1 CR5-6]|uniref:Uncharacterized protein n=1 Tax=Phlebiopsis gigantea (strain 11061_1 CR5-6) TaxID=745531 RepID=A0A0C3RU14_PHLG1|nr:hypothetical protein PHLGIDRAFT_129554 [Phlebiopsis gigantea 11061_1 CR5-6]